MGATYFYETQFEIGTWLIQILSNDDDVYQEICSEDHNPSIEYEFEGD